MGFLRSPREFNKAQFVAPLALAVTGRENLGEFIMCRITARPGRSDLVRLDDTVAWINNQYSVSNRAKERLKKRFGFAQAFACLFTEFFGMCVSVEHSLLVAM